MEGRQSAKIWELMTGATLVGALAYVWSKAYQHFVCCYILFRFNNVVVISRLQTAQDSSKILVEETNMEIGSGGYGSVSLEQWFIHVDRFSQRRSDEL